MSTPIVVGVDFSNDTWGDTEFRSDHPTDEALLLSVRTWAQEAGLGDAIDDECGPTTPRTTPQCATFLTDNLDAWAAWYEANN